MNDEIEMLPVVSHEYLVEFRPYEDAALDKGWGRAVRIPLDNGRPWSRWSAHHDVKRMNMASYGEQVSRVLRRPVGDWFVDKADE